MRYRPKRNVLNVIPGRATARTRNDDTSSFQLFVGDDLDAKAGKSLVVMHRGREVDDRGDAEIAQDLGADADFTPLPVAIGFRRLLFADRLDRNPGRAVAQ